MFWQLISLRVFYLESWKFVTILQKYFFVVVVLKLGEKKKKRSLSIFFIKVLLKMYGPLQSTWLLKKLHELDTNPPQLQA